MMTTAELIQVILTGVLVLITAVYAWRTFVISKSAGKQADASAKMANEMEEQRIQESRPTIIQKAVHNTKDNTFQHFEIYNAGKGASIELEISIVGTDRNKAMRSVRKTYLRANQDYHEYAHDVQLQNYQDKGIIYLVSEYRGIASSTTQGLWYQTWLPLLEIKPSSIAGRVYVTCGELEFKEVRGKDRVNAFQNVRQMENKP